MSCCYSYPTWCVSFLQAIVSHQFLRTSFAGPRYQSGQPCTWWLIDLGPDHRLLCNYYTLRQDGSTDFARHWVLQVTGVVQGLGVRVQGQLWFNDCGFL